MRPSALTSVKPVAVVMRTYQTEYAIYGIVLVSALIAVGWKFDTDWEVLLYTLGTIGVFWLAHIYSGVVATEREDGPRAQAIWEATVRSARHSVGMLLAMLLPAVFLLLAAAGVMDEYVAYYIALWVGVAILAVLGYLNSARRQSHWTLRVLSALATSLLGIGVILLSSIVH